MLGSWGKGIWGSFWNTYSRMPMMPSPNLTQSLILCQNCILLVAIWKWNCWTISVNNLSRLSTITGLYRKKATTALALLIWLWPSPPRHPQKGLHNNLHVAYIITVLKIKSNRRPLVSFSQCRTKLRESCSEGRSYPRQGSSSNNWCCIKTAEWAHPLHIGLHVTV